MIQDNQKLTNSLLSEKQLAKAMELALSTQVKNITSDTSL
jgi:hypothetical protein